MIRHPPASILFPYTTLFRSVAEEEPGVQQGAAAVGIGDAAAQDAGPLQGQKAVEDRKSTRLNSSHDQISYAVFCLKKKNKIRCSNASTTTSTTHADSIVIGS